MHRATCASRFYLDPDTGDRGLSRGKGTTVAEVPLHSADEA
jgi:hypothetical protein